MKINDYALVRLTLAGLKQHSAYYSSLKLTSCQFTEKLSHQEVGDGRHRFTIDELMRIFGGQTPAKHPDGMFVDNDIVFVPANTKSNS